MKVLFITSNRLGDAVLSTGLLGHLADHWPEARFTVACGPVAADLFRAVPRLDAVIAFGKRPWSEHWLLLWYRCAGTFWDLVVDLRNSAVSRLLPAGRVVIAPRPDARLHRVEHLARLLDADPPPAPRLWLGPEDEAVAADLVPDGPPVLALGPAANWIGKTWRAERFVALAEKLTAPDGLLPGARVAVLAAAHEREQAEPLLDAVSAERLIDLVGRTTPRQAGACLRRCALFVGNDSGLMHIAAAGGVPTLGLFGPSRAEHYRPWGPRAMAVRTAIPYDMLVGGPGYDHRTTGTLMDSLRVDAVVRAATTLWRRIHTVSPGPERVREQPSTAGECP